MIGLSTRGSISLGGDLVAGKNRVPNPAAGNTALRTGRFMTPVCNTCGRTCVRRPICAKKNSMPDARFDMAVELYRKAYQLQMQGEPELAVSLYKRSIDLHPTAEAY